MRTRAFPVFRLSVRSWRTGVAVGVLACVALLVGGTAAFLRFEADRLRLPSPDTVSIPVLDERLLSEFAARVPR